MSTGQTLHDRVTELLNDAEAELDSLSDPADAESPDANARIDELATEATELIGENDPEALLEATGLAGSDDVPDTIPGAIAQGDPEDVATLRSLLALSKLSDRDRDAELGEELRAVDEALEARSREADPADEGEGPDEETTESDAGGDVASDESSTDDRESEAVEAAEGGETDDADDEGTDHDGGDADLEDEVRSAFGDAIGGFRDEIDEARGHLEGLQSSEGAESADEAADGPDEDAETAEPATEADEEEAHEKDEAVEEDEAGNGRFGRTGSDSSETEARHSTLPPSPSERADMGGVARLSTMPKRNR